jgi:hypothetical protein
VSASCALLIGAAFPAVKLSVKRDSAARLPFISDTRAGEESPRRAYGYHGTVGLLGVAEADDERPRENYERPLVNYASPQANYVTVVVNYVTAEDNYGSAEDNYVTAEEICRGAEENYVTIV